MSGAVDIVGDVVGGVFGVLTGQKPDVPKAPDPEETAEAEAEVSAVARDRARRAAAARDGYAASLLTRPTTGASTLGGK